MAVVSQFFLDVWFLGLRVYAASPAASPAGNRATNALHSRERRRRHYAAPRTKR